MRGSLASHSSISPLLRQSYLHNLLFVAPDDASSICNCFGECIFWFVFDRLSKYKPKSTFIPNATYQQLNRIEVLIYDFVITCQGISFKNYSQVYNRFMANFINVLERLSLGVREEEISPISQASLLFTKLKQLYLQDQREQRKQEIQTKTSVFHLQTKINKPQYQINYQTASVIPSTIQNKVSIPSESICSMIKIINLIISNANQQLIARIEDCLVRKICQLKNPEEILKMFSKVVYMKKYLENGYDSYRLIQDRIIKQLMNISFKNQNPDILSKFIYSLPFRTKSLLPLLSYFIEEISDQDGIKTLYNLFNQLFPSNPSRQDIKCLLSISTKQATQRINQMTKRQEIDSLQMLEEEAKRKLKKMPRVFNSKGQASMIFIFFVALYGGSIWQEIIQWEKTAIGQYKDWFKNNAQSIVNDNHAKDHLEVILLKLTNINYESEISELFFDHVIQQKNKQMLNSVIVKRFLSSKIFHKLQILKANNQKLSTSKLAIIFDPSLIYVDILLELFEDQNRSRIFYCYLLQSDQQNSRILIKYLDQCFLYQKFKFVGFFLNFMNTSKSEILEAGSNRLLRYYHEIKIDLQLAYVLSKEMSLGSPSKFYILFMNAWMFRKFTNQPSQQILRSSIVRNINIMLIRPQVQLSKQFLIDFKQKFYNQLNRFQQSKILTDVPKVRRDALGV